MAKCLHNFVEARQRSVLDFAHGVASVVHHELLLDEDFVCVCNDLCADAPLGHANDFAAGEGWERVPGGCLNDVFDRNKEQIIRGTEGVAHASLAGDLVHHGVARVMSVLQVVEDPLLLCRCEL